jgi:ABC-type branched-subunit amino acid transport system ATPase component
MASEAPLGAPTEKTQTQGTISNPPPSILEVQRLVKAFGGLRAVDDCSFTVARGSITGLIGPNGAGKSTVANLITGFLRADAGPCFLMARTLPACRFTASRSVA